MVSWKEVCEGAPEFGSRVEQALTRSKHMTMATLRADGSPRISGTELEVSEGELWLGSMPRAHKALDLLRDPRVAIHGPSADPPDDPKGWIGEAKVAGRAVDVPHDDSSHRFRVDVEEVVFTHLNNAGDRLVVESWHPGRGVEAVEREQCPIGTVPDVPICAGCSSRGRPVDPVGITPPGDTGWLQPWPGEPTSVA